MQQVDPSNNVEIRSSNTVVTLTSSSWLDAVEGWFAQLERRALYRGIFTSVPELKAERERFIKVHNAESAKPFKWTKPASHVLASVGCTKDALHN